ncbi:MAG TPA: Gfo/Idh/MocA family oxidoreductase [Blastocatellia bacterium]|nr:Gfo/Idh/MocA family oxidoreductase [Blastocatellia bacterium]
MGDGLKHPRVAVVGSGYWGANHVRNYYELGALAAVCDTDQTLLDQIHGRYPEVRTELDYTKVLEDKSIDGVVIATPAETHFRLASLAIEAGKDVLVEKPLTLRVEEGERLVEMAGRKKSILMVGHLLEYHPAVLRLVEMVRSGALGDLRYMYSTRLNLGKVRREENILWSFAPHDICIILRLVGANPVRVTATGGAYLQPKIADVTVTNLEFPAGVRGHIFVSWLHPYKEQRLVVIGSQRMAVFDDVRTDGKLVIYDQGVDFVDGQPVMRKSSGVIEPLDVGEPLRRQCLVFLDSIRSRTRPLTDGASGLQVLRVLNAAEESLRLQGTPIECPPGMPG